MSSLCKVQLIGNLGNEPDIRSMQNGGKVCNLSIATSESWKDKNSGERKTKTEWHRVVVFNEGLIGVIERYVNKGSKVYIEGALETRKWQDQSGQDKYSTEVVLKGFNGNLVMLDGKQEGQSSHNEAKSNGYQQQGGGDGFDDEIPFARINDKVITI